MHPMGVAPEHSAHLQSQAEGLVMMVAIGTARGEAEPSDRARQSGAVEAGYGEAEPPGPDDVVRRST